LCARYTTNWSIHAVNPADGVTRSRMNVVPAVCRLMHPPDSRAARHSVELSHTRRRGTG